MSHKETVTGTVVHASTSWEHKVYGTMTHKVRLDDGKLLIVENALSSMAFDDEREGFFDALFDKVGSGVGHRLSIDLVYPKEDTTKAVYILNGVRDLGLSKKFRNSVFCDKGVFDSLSIVSSVRGNTIKCEVGLG